MAIVFEPWAECGGEEECRTLAARFPESHAYHC